MCCLWLLLLLRRRRRRLVEKVRHRGRLGIGLAAALRFGLVGLLPRRLPSLRLRNQLLLLGFVQGSPPHLVCRLRLRLRRPALDGCGGHSSAALFGGLLDAESRRLLLRHRGALLLLVRSDSAAHLHNLGGTSIFHARLPLRHSLVALLPLLLRSKPKGVRLLLRLRGLLLLLRARFCRDRTLLLALRGASIVHGYQNLRILLRCSVSVELLCPVTLYLGCGCVDPLLRPGVRLLLQLLLAPLPELCLVFAHSPSHLLNHRRVHIVSSMLVRELERLRLRCGWWRLWLVDWICRHVAGRVCRRWRLCLIDWIRRRVAGRVCRDGVVHPACGYGTRNGHFRNSRQIRLSGSGAAPARRAALASLPWA